MLFAHICDEEPAARFLIVKTMRNHGMRNRRLHAVDLHKYRFLMVRNRWEPAGSGGTGSSSPPYGEEPGTAPGTGSTETEHPGGAR